MRLEYDPSVDVAYLYLSDSQNIEVSNTISLNDSINLDIDKDGKTLGIEIIDATKNMHESAIKTAKIIK